jgi:hypothetical protein
MDDKEDKSEVTMEQIDEYLLNYDLSTEELAEKMKIDTDQVLKIKKKVRFVTLSSVKEYIHTFLGLTITSDASKDIVKKINTYIKEQLDLILKKMPKVKQGINKGKKLKRKRITVKLLDDLSFPKIVRGSADDYFSESDSVL